MNPGREEDYKRWLVRLIAALDNAPNSFAYGLTAIIIPREMAWLPSSWSFYLVNVITNVLLVGLLTFVAMPIAARVLRRWLY